MRLSEKISKIFKPAFVTAVYLLGWEILSLAVGNSLLLPDPFETVERLVQLVMNGETWICLAVTMFRVISGLICGTVCGILFAVICQRSSTLDILLRPIRDIVKTTPVSSGILLLILWISSANVPIVISALMVMPIVWTSVYSGLSSCDRELYEMTNAFRFSRRMKLRYYWIPSVRPAFTAAVSTSLGFAWKSAIAAEVLVVPRTAVGRQLYQSKLTLETVELFAWTLLVILVSFLIEKVVAGLLKKMK